MEARLLLKIFFNRFCYNFFVFFCLSVLKACPPLSDPLLKLTHYFFGSFQEIVLSPLSGPLQQLSPTFRSTSTLTHKSCTPHIPVHSCTPSCIQVINSYTTPNYYFYFIGFVFQPYLFLLIVYFNTIRQNITSLLKCIITRIFFLNTFFSRVTNYLFN